MLAKFSKGTYSAAVIILLVMLVFGYLYVDASYRRRFCPPADTVKHYKSTIIVFSMIKRHHIGALRVKGGGGRCKMDNG